MTYFLSSLFCFYYCQWIIKQHVYERVKTVKIDQQRTHKNLMLESPANLNHNNWNGWNSLKSVHRQAFHAYLFLYEKILLFGELLYRFVLSWFTGPSPPKDLNLILDYKWNNYLILQIIRRWETPQSHKITVIKLIKPIVFFMIIESRFRSYKISPTRQCHTDSCYDKDDDCYHRFVLSSNINYRRW